MHGMRVLLVVMLVGCVQPVSPAQPSPPSRPAAMSPALDAGAPPDALALDARVAVEGDAAVVLAPLATLDRSRTTRLGIDVFETVIENCGGAALPYELMHRTRPAAQLLLFRHGSVNTAAPPLVERASDERGQLTIDLPAGTYCVVTAAKRDPSQQPTNAGARIDSACVERLARTCDATFTTPVKQVRIDLYRSTCFGPCYVGPMPP
jgi:hypothetical protein